MKEKIVQSDGFKDAQIKELPKTLKGLSELAQKIGIDISKITIVGSVVMIILMGYILKANGTVTSLFANGNQRITIVQVGLSY